MQNDRNDTFTLIGRLSAHARTRTPFRGGNVISVILGKFIGEPRRFTVTTKPKRARVAQT